MNEEGWEFANTECEKCGELDSEWLNFKKKVLYPNSIF